MALGRAFSVAVRSLDGEIVEIEADITSGLPGVHLVGLPDAALQESRDRVRAAITNCGHDWPMARLTLALSPATLPKMGSVYDLALACAVLSANKKKSWERLEKTVLLGELALDGRVRPVKGVLPAVLAAKREGWPAVVVPVRQSRGGQPGRRHRSVGRAHTGPTAQMVDRSHSTRRPNRCSVVSAGAGRRPRRCGGSIACPVRSRGRRGRCPSPDDDRPARCGQNDAGATPSGPTAAVVGGRGTGGHGHPLGGGLLSGSTAADHPAAVCRAAPHVERRGAGRRRLRARPAGRGQPCAPGRLVPRRVCGDRRQRRWKRCELRWRKARFGSPDVTASHATRRDSSWCWPPTRARVRRRIRKTASARRWPSGDISASSPGRCWIESTCASRCIRRARVPLQSRTASRRRRPGTGGGSARRRRRTVAATWHPHQR